MENKFRLKNLKGKDKILFININVITMITIIILSAFMISGMWGTIFLLLILIPLRNGIYLLSNIYCDWIYEENSKIQRQ